MANPIDPCRSTLKLENEKFREADSGGTCVAVCIEEGDVNIGAVSVEGEYNATPPTLPDGGTDSLQLDSNGRLITSPDFRETSFVFNATGDEITLPCMGLGSFYVQMNGSFSGTFQVQGSLDGTFFNAIPVYDFVGRSTQISITTNSLFGGSMGALKFIRLKAVTLGSGTPTGIVTCSWNAGPQLVISERPEGLRVESRTHDAAGADITSTTVGSNQALDVNVANNIAPAGLNTAGKITEIALTSTGWTALPASALVNRNGIAVQNGLTEIKLNFDNAEPGYVGWKIAALGETFVDITDAVTIYAKAQSGTPTITVMEVS